MILDDHFNFIQTQVLTETGDSFKGVMGLGNTASPDLWLKDGIYSMWNSPDPVQPADGEMPGKNSHGTYPFYMGRKAQDSWFGVYTNLAAAQDWEIKNDKVKGSVNIKISAAGGVGDILLMSASTPEKIT
jgi:hypothetical protein